MKKYMLLVVFVTAGLICFPQSENAKKLVQEGIVLHDKGDYEGALKKYDAAIAEDPALIDAYYEKTYTLYSLRKLDECIELSKKMIKDFPGNPILKGVYVQWGSSLDDLGKPGEAIKIYNEGLKAFPNYFLLNFNKAITYAIMNDYDKAYTCFQESLIANPLHASSYFRVAGMLKTTNRIPAMMACIMHLIVEPQSDRSEVSFNSLKQMIYANVKKTGDNNITITMTPDMLDTKKNKKEPDNFRTQDMLFTLSSALDKDSVMNTITKTDIEKFDLKLQLLINSLTDNQKGFFSERYVPFFKAMKEKNYTMIVSRLVFAHTEDADNDAWLSDNGDKVDEFYDWVKTYKWPGR